MDFLETKYLKLVSPKLELFQDTGNDIYAFRCPFCGDSKKHKFKKRGYFYRNPVPKFNRGFWYKCHNCGSSLPLMTFIKLIDFPLFLDWRKEKFKPVTRRTITQEETKTSVRFADNFTLDEFGDRLSTVEDFDPVLQYALARKIPKRFYRYLYSIKDITKVTSSIEQYQDRNIQPSRALGIPYFREDLSLDFVQFRLLDSKSLRYLTICVGSPDAVKFWGEPFVDWNQKVFVFEGPIDAMFINNGIAASGVGYRAILNHLDGKVEDRKNVVFCYDNELHSNREVRRAMEERVNQGFSLVVYDKNFRHKDINDAVMAGMTVESINTYVRKRVFNGMSAKLQLAFKRR